MAWWHWSYTVHWIQAAIVLYVRADPLPDGDQAEFVSPPPGPPPQAGEGEGEGIPS